MSGAEEMTSKQKKGEGGRGTEQNPLLSVAVYERGCVRMCLERPVWEGVWWER